jgi:hypothetical protein
MKSNVKILAFMIILAVTGSMALSAQPGMRGMRGMRPDSTVKGRIDRMQMPGMSMYRGMGRMNDNFTTPFGMRRIQQGFGQRGMAMRRPGMGMRPGMLGLNNIPNLTDKQKKDIADLQGKQQAEMEKLRIDMQSKMKELREAHRAKVMNLLTDEQKKWVEEHTPKPESQK